MLMIIGLIRTSWRLCLTCVNLNTVSSDVARSRDPVERFISPVGRVPTRTTSHEPSISTYFNGV